jgi:hypothetical protein
MRNIFKRRIPAHRAEPARISPEDVDIADWHGYSAAQWCVLPALVQVDKRESFFQARGL